MPERINIILVEDNPADVLLMELTLKEASVNYSMKILEDGEQAIDYFEDSTED